MRASSRANGVGGKGACGLARNLGETLTNLQKLWLLAPRRLFFGICILSFLSSNLLAELCTGTDDGQRCLQKQRFNFSNKIILNFMTLRFNEYEWIIKVVDVRIVNPIENVIRFGNNGLQARFSTNADSALNLRTGRNAMYLWPAPKTHCLMRLYCLASSVEGPCTSDRRHPELSNTILRLFLSVEVRNAIHSAPMPEPLLFSAKHTSVHFRRLRNHMLLYSR